MALLSGIGKLLGGPLGNGILSLGKALGKGLFKIFLEKPKLAKNALKAGIEIKGRADVARAKLAKKDPEALQADKLRRRKDKQAEYDIVNAMDVQKLTSEATRLNTIKARAVDLGEQRFIGAMSNINRSTINTGKLKSSASILANTTVPINDIPRNTVQNNIIPGNMTSISNSAASLTTIAAQNPEAKPIVELGQVLTQQNMAVASMNTENAQKLGEMIKQSSEIEMVNSQALMNANNSIVKLTNTQNTVISDTATVIANVQDELPQALNATAESLTTATAGLIKNSTDMEKDAIVNVGEDITQKLNTLGSSVASANALIIRNDNQGTDQILESMSDSNLLVESKLNSLLLHEEKSGKKWSDILKIGKEIVREFIKEQLVSLFEVFIGIRDLFYDTPLMRKLRSFLDVSYDANEKDAVRKDQAAYNSKKAEYDALIAQGDKANKDEITRITMEMATMEANDSKWKSVELRNSGIKITDENFMGQLDTMKESTWYQERKELWQEIIDANYHNLTKEHVQAMYDYALKYADHRYQAWNFVDATGTFKGSNFVYDNEDLSARKNSEQKFVIYDTRIKNSALDSPWYAKKKTYENVMRLCYAVDSSYYEDIHLDDFFFASFDYLFEQKNVFDKNSVRHIARSLFNYTVGKDLNVARVAFVLGFVQSNVDTYINKLMARCPETYHKILKDGAKIFKSVKDKLKKSKNITEEELLTSDYMDAYTQEIQEQIVKDQKTLGLSDEDVTRMTNDFHNVTVSRGVERQDYVNKVLDLIRGKKITEWSNWHDVETRLREAFPTHTNDIERDFTIVEDKDSAGNYNFVYLGKKGERPKYIPENMWEELQKAGMQTEVNIDDVVNSISSGSPALYTMDNQAKHSFINDSEGAYKASLYRELTANATNLIQQYNNTEYQDLYNEMTGRLDAIKNSSSDDLVKNNEILNLLTEIHYRLGADLVSSKSAAATIINNHYNSYINQNKTEKE